MALHCKTCALVILMFGIHICDGANKDVFLKNLFDKYGDGDHMTFEGFEHLISSIGLGQIKIEDHSTESHKQNGNFTELHPNHNHIISHNHTSGHEPGDEHVHEHGHEHDDTHEHVDHDHGNEHSDYTSLNIGEVERCSGKECFQECLPPKSILASLGLEEGSRITPSDFTAICPTLVSQLDSRVCTNSMESEEHYHSTNSSIVPHTASLTVWGCSFGAVLIISLIGLLSVAVIPIIQKKFYHSLLQFLVAMAVGTLTGDAVLHLLPHAFAGGHSHEVMGGHSTVGVWRGLVVLGGFYVFFIVERIVSIIASNRHALREKRKLRKKLHASAGQSEEDKVGDCGSCSDLTMVVHTSKALRTMAADAHEDWHLMNNIPCSKGMTPHGSIEHMPVSTDPKYCQPSACGGETQDCHSKHFTDELTPSTEISNVDFCDDTCKRHSIEDIKDSSAFLHGGDAQNPDEPCKKNGSHVTGHHGDDEHDHHEEGEGHGHGHGHGHSHGHSHGVPKSVSAVAWMVIMGDGLHNFCDGMAIGAAFTTGLGGGLSTTIAVTCHELPHELGDFAMLLQAGMSAKKAIVYNMVSSLLCLVGMVLGILLGNIADASLWLFAMTGGMFIYIALVDMLPELTAAYKGAKKPYRQLLIQNIGLLVGMSIMLLIALFEDEIIVAV